jgi:predicted PurR-regulated permease PerM
VFTIPASKRARVARHELSEAQFDRMLGITSRLGMVFIALLAIIVVLQVGHAILAPVGLALVVGLVFGPIADLLERRGIRPGLSAGLVVLLFLMIIGVGITLLAVPLGEWVARGPAIWQKLQTELVRWQEPLQMLGSLQDQIKSVFGSDETLAVTVEDSNQVIDLAFSLPMFLGDVLIFLGSLYFYLATRESIRISILALCVTRRMRWRAAHIFRDVEGKVSQFLLSVTMLNIGVGVVMTLVTWWLGLPSPLLWGVLAGILNYIPYVGQAVMILILAAVGLGTQPDLPHVLAPIGIYLLVNLIEGQFLFPMIVGHRVTINPFLIFLSIIFWIFVWGPVGSLMAVPALIIVQSIVAHVLPTKEVKPRRPVRRTGNMSTKDVVLANAAKAIREQAEDEAADVAAAETAKADAETAKAEAKDAAKAEVEAAKAEAVAAKAEPAPAATKRTPKRKTPAKTATA